MKRNYKMRLNDQHIKKLTGLMKELEAHEGSQDLTEEQLTNAESEFQEELQEFSRKVDWNQRKKKTRPGMFKQSYSFMAAAAILMAIPFAWPQFKRAFDYPPTAIQGSNELGLTKGLTAPEELCEVYLKEVCNGSPSDSILLTENTVNKITSPNFILHLECPSIQKIKLTAEADSQIIYNRELQLKPGRNMIEDAGQIKLFKLSDQDKNLKLLIGAESQQQAYLLEVDHNGQSCQ